MWKAGMRIHEFICGYIIWDSWKYNAFADPVKKPVRPLSANRKAPDVHAADPDREASAVMAALREENEQASKHRVVRCLLSGTVGNLIAEGQRV